MTIDLNGGGDGEQYTLWQGDKKYLIPEFGKLGEVHGIGIMTDL